MTSYNTPNLNLELAVPGTNEPFSTPTVNANFEAIDTEVGTSRAAIVLLQNADVALDTRLDTIEAGSGRGALARSAAANPAALTAIANALVGDRVRVTAPGTGIEPFWAECFASPGSTASDWRPAEAVVADTKAHLDTFIAAWVADADLTFAVGGLALVTGTGYWYRLTSTAGARVLLPVSDIIVPTATPTGGTAVVDAETGRITVSGSCTILDLTGFDALSEDYLLEGFLDTTTTVSPLMQIIVAASPITTSTYNYTPVGGAASGAVAFWALGGGANGTHHQFEARVSRTQSVAEKQFSSAAHSKTGANADAAAVNRGHNTTTSVVTGVRIYLNGAGNMSGVLTVRRAGRV